MRASIAAVADRLLTVVVPKAEASAGCPPDPYYVNCFCSSSYLWQKRCSTSLGCKTTCGSCYRTSTRCS